jgi:hypothetical protein
MKNVDLCDLLANLNTREQLGSDTLKLQPELYNFHAIYK